MSQIKLNLKARQADLLDKWGSKWNWRKEFSKHYGDIYPIWHGTKKDLSLVKRHIGIKTARELVRSFKESGLCPSVERVSFSQIIINY